MAKFEINVSVNGEASIKSLDDKLKSVDTSAKTASKSTDIASKSFSSLASSVVPAIAALTSFAAAANVVKSSINVAGKFEQYAVSLKVLSGSAKEAEKSLGWVKDFTAKTPFTLDQTMESFIRLKAYGIDPMNGSLKTLGDTASAMGKPVMAAVEAMADAIVGENERLKEFGIRAAKSGDEIKYSWTTSSGEAKSQIIKNNSEIIQSTLTAIFNEKYAGMMDEQSKTWVGMVSNMEDAWTGLLDEVAHSSGIFDTAKSTIKSLTTIIQNSNGELDTLERYTKDAAVAVGSLTGMVVGYNTAQKLSALYTAASTVTTTGYNIATNTATTSVVRLTAAQVALNGATAMWNRLLAVNPLILGGMALAGGIAYFYNMAEEAEQKAKKINDDRMIQDKKYQDHLATSEGKAEKIGESYKALENSLASLQKARQNATGTALTNIDSRITSTKKAMDNLQIQAKKIYTPVAKSKDADVDFTSTDKPKKGPKPKTAEEIIKEEHDKNQAILDGLQKKTDNQQKYDDMVYSNIKKTEDATKSMYASMFQASGDWYTAESVKIGEQYNEWEKLGVDKLALQEWLNVSILSIDEKRIKEQQEIDKKALDEKNKLWADFFKDLDKAMDNQLFDAMSGKWESFGSWLKDFWSSLTTSIARAASSQLSQSLIGGIKDMMGLGTSGEASWIQNAFKATAGASLGVGSTLSASQMSSLGGIADSMGFTTTSGGTVVDAAGQITKAGSDLSGLANSVSSLNSVYSALTGGLSASIANGFAQGAAYTYNGLTAIGVSSGTAGSIAGGIGNFGGGLSAPWSTGAGSGMAAQGGAMLGGAAIGAAGGYALGTIGDKLFGADTKAAKFGAIGGAIGSLGGPIGAIAGAAIGSLIGGAFGSKKVKDQGLSFAQQSAADNVDKFVMSFVDMQKKSWFSNKKWTDYKALSENEKSQIVGIFDTYDYLLGALGDNDKIFLQAGKYSGQSFLDQLAKNFISVLKTGGDTTDIYNAWKDYAKQIGVTIQEAFGASIQEMITSQRTFQEWALGSGTIEQIAFTANYLQKDFEALANSMGVTNVNVGNFATMYDSAIKANFTPENIAKWNSLGESLMATTEATVSYNNALLEQNSIVDDMLNKSMEGLRMALDGVNTIAKKTIGLFKSLKDSTASIRESLLSSASGDQTKYYLMQFQDLKKEFMSNFDASGIVYANSVEKMESDYAKLTASISSIGGVGTSGQKSALVGQLDMFGQMFDKNSQALSVLIVGDETGSASESTLTNVEQWIKSLYAVQEQAKIAESASLTQSSFAAGHQLGTQEKIDFAKTTGLTIGSTAFNQAITDIQGFATQSDDVSYLAGLSGLSGSSVSNTSILRAIQSLGSIAPTEAKSALQGVTGLLSDSANSEYAENMLKRDIALNSYNQINGVIGRFRKIHDDWWQSTNEVADNEILKKYGSGGFNTNEKRGENANQAMYNSYVELANSYLAESKKYDLPLKTSFGFAQGGYTGDIATNQIAGVTHGQEYVVNAKTTRDLGLNNSGGLFREMANEIKSLKNEVLKLNQVAMSQLREAIGGNIIMRQVTNGGNAMMIEVI